MPLTLLPSFFPLLFFQDPSILLLNIELELKSEKENAEVRLDDPTQYQSIVDAGEWYCREWYCRGGTAWVVLQGVVLQGGDCGDRV